jgi:hypothetical protein
MRRSGWLALTIVVTLLARPNPVRYLRWEEIQPCFAAFAAAGQRAPTFTDTAEFDEWIRQRDAEVRGRIERGMEDAIGRWALVGLASADAVNAAGDLTPGARSRVDAFVKAIEDQSHERLALVREFLSLQGIPEEEARAFVIGIARRYALEQAGFQKKHAQAPQRFDEGISPEASLLEGFAIEDSLANLKGRGALHGPIRRVAVIGPGLDFDPASAQSIQPFAVLDSVLRLGLAQAADVEITAFDLNPIVVAHLKMLPAKIRGGRYVLQLPRQGAAGWNAGAISYWQHLGEGIGKAQDHAVTIKGGLRVVAEELNIVEQTREVAAGQGFDLVVATNVFHYYNVLEQAMALTNIAQMMASGGIVLANNSVPTDKVQSLEYLGVRRVAFAEAGAGDDVQIFRRR